MSSEKPKKEVRKGGKYKGLLEGLILLIGSLLIFLLAAEGLTRLVVPTSVKLRLMHQPDERLGYRLVPNYTMEHMASDFDTFIKINSKGLRDYSHEEKRKDPTTYRILVLGDSFTFGLGVNLDDSYPKVLENMLNMDYMAEVAKQFEVINAGVPGYGTEQEYLYLEELGKLYKPDLVIVGIYSNDVNDVMSGIPLALHKNKLKSRFYFLSYLRSLQLSLSQSFSKNIQTEFFQIYQDTYTPEFTNALTKTKDYLMKIRDFNKSLGAKTMIVTIPFCFEIDSLEWEKRGLGHLFNIDFLNKNMTRFSDTFEEFGEKNDIPTLPLLPVFKGSKVRPLYFTVDPHWTKEGHRLAAGSIYRFLKEKHLITIDKGKQ